VVNAASTFVQHVSELAPVFVAAPGGQEFRRPPGWQELDRDGNDVRLKEWEPGYALCAVTGTMLAVVDVDPRNGGQVELVRQLLDGLNVRVFAEVDTPGGGVHFYVHGHADLPSCHELTGFPGVDVQSHGAHVFLPGTARPKYDGDGYLVRFDNLEALADGGDPDGAESLADWVATHRQARRRELAPPTSPPWDGTPPDDRQAAYLATVLSNQAAEVASATPGTRNPTLNRAAFLCGQFIAGAGLDELGVVQALADASVVNGLVADDGEGAVHDTIRSGLRGGKANPRAVPDLEPVTVLLPQAQRELTDGLLGRVLRRSELGDLPPLKPLIKGLLDYPSAAILVGSYGIGKTFLGLSLACCVATGRPWLGQPVERRKVLLVVGEGGSGLDRRLTAWEQGYNQGQPVGDDDLLIVVQPKSLASNEPWQRIGELCAAEGVGFVILDTFSSLAPDADETKDAAQVLSRMHRLAAGLNGTVLLVHHPGWGDSGRTRGGYQFEANADFVLVLTGTPEEPLVQLRRKKVKDGQDGQVFWMRRKPYALSGQHAGETSVVMESVDSSQVGVPLVERIKVVLDACGPVGATGPQLKEELGGDALKRSTFYDALNRAVAEGVASKSGNGNQSRYFAAGQP
jgi:hypothetical protein